MRLPPIAASIGLLGLLGVGIFFGSWMGNAIRNGPQGAQVINGGPTGTTGASGTTSTTGASGGPGMTCVSPEYLCSTGDSCLNACAQIRECNINQGFCPEPGNSNCVNGCCECTGCRKCRSDMPGCGWNPNGGCTCPSGEWYVNGQCVPKGQYNCNIDDNQPVCGCDGYTYTNGCIAQWAGLKSWKEGECLPVDQDPNCQESSSSIRSSAQSSSQSMSQSSGQSTQFQRCIILKTIGFTCTPPKIYDSTKDQMFTSPDQEGFDAVCCINASSSSAGQSQSSSGRSSSAGGASSSGGGSSSGAQSSRSSTGTGQSSSTGGGFSSFGQASSDGGNVGSIGTDGDSSAPACTVPFDPQPPNVQCRYVTCGGVCPQGIPSEMNITIDPDDVQGGLLGLPPYAGSCSRETCLTTAGTFTLSYAGDSPGGGCIYTASFSEPVCPCDQYNRPNWNADIHGWQLQILTREQYENMLPPPPGGDGDRDTSIPPSQAYLSYLQGMAPRFYKWQPNGYWQCGATNTMHPFGYQDTGGIEVCRYNMPINVLEGPPNNQCNYSSRGGGSSSKRTQSSSVAGGRSSSTTGGTSCYATVVETTNLSVANSARVLNAPDNSLTTFAVTDDFVTLSFSKDIMNQPGADIRIFMTNPGRFLWVWGGTANDQESLIGKIDSVSASGYVDMDLGWLPSVRYIRIQDTGDIASNGELANVDAVEGFVCVTSSTSSSGGGSSSGTGQSSSARNSCNGAECILGGNQFCAQSGRTCIPDPQDPECIRCIPRSGNSSAGAGNSSGGGTSTGNTSSRRSSSGGNNSSDAIGTNGTPSGNTGVIGPVFTSSAPRGPRCGNGILEGLELCDDGNLVESDACTTRCLYGIDQACRRNDQCASGRCINGQCTAVCTSDMQCDAPRICVQGSCQLPRCGDDVISFGEGCDLGQKCTSDPESCNRPIGTAGALCYCDPEEKTCPTPPGVVYTKGCIRAYCGDGIVNNLAVKDGRAVNYEFVHEECDDGALNGTVTSLCQSNCTLQKPITCGDARIQAPEECDKGAQNTDTAPNGCRTNCRSAYCGDGIVDSTEECDLGGMNGTPGSLCNAFCKIPSFDLGDLEPSAGDPTITYEFPYLGPDGQPIPGTTGSPLTGQVTPVSHPPVGEQGPAAIAAIALGAAAGWMFFKRRKRIEN